MCIPGFCLTRFLKNDYLCDQWLQQCLIEIKMDHLGNCAQKYADSSWMCIACSKLGSHDQLVFYQRCNDDLSSMLHNLIMKWSFYVLIALLASFPLYFVVALIVNILLMSCWTLLGRLNLHCKSSLLLAWIPCQLDACVIFMSPRNLWSCSILDWIR